MSYHREPMSKSYLPPKRIHAVAVLDLVEAEQQKGETIVQTFCRMAAVEAMRDSIWDATVAARRLGITQKTVWLWRKGVRS